MDNGSKGKKKGALSELATAETMFELALAVPVGCLLGWLAGTALDKHFHTDWMGVAGIVLGAIGGFIQIFRTAMLYLKGGKR